MNKQTKIVLTQSSSVSLIVFGLGLVVVLGIQTRYDTCVAGRLPAKNSHIISFLSTQIFRTLKSFFVSTHHIKFYHSFTNSQTTLARRLKSTKQIKPLWCQAEMCARWLGCMLCVLGIGQR